MASPYPLLFEPILLEKVWGGRRLARYGKRLPEGKPPYSPPLIGESWEIADLDSTAESGAGGGAARSVVRNGVMAGKTLREVMEEWGQELLGKSAMSRSTDFATPKSVARETARGFPLLIKYLDAQENLSVQVHPSAAYAAAHPGAHLKTEAWYIVEAEPGSMVYLGLREGVGPEELREHIARGSVREALRALPAVPGACHTLPSGLCHALGAGVLVAEVQTPSDTTFRVWDWGRSGRAMHVEAALACIAGSEQRVEATEIEGGVLARTPQFEIRRGRAGAVEGAGRCRVVMVTGGRADLEWKGEGGGAMELAAGDTALVPAATQGVTMSAERGCEWLVVMM